MRLVDESVFGATHGDQGLEALDEDVLLLVSMSSNTRRLRSSWRCTGRRRSRRYSWSTRSSSNGWRRRNCMALNNMRLISSMLSIISKLHVGLAVDDSLNVCSIDHIGSFMV
jgi:hypothetical protein